eukprot:g1271.t1
MDEEGNIVPNPSRKASKNGSMDIDSGLGKKKDIVLMYRENEQRKAHMQGLGFRESGKNYPVADSRRMSQVARDQERMKRSLQKGSSGGSQDFYEAEGSYEKMAREKEEIQRSNKKLKAELKELYAIIDEGKLGKKSRSFTTTR